MAYIRFRYTCPNNAKGQTSYSPKTLYKIVPKKDKKNE